MQIKFNNVVLAGEWSQSSDGLTREVSTIVQRTDFFRGSEPKWFNRDNYSASISFSTTRLFESIPAAEMFFLEHGDNEGTKTATQLTGIVEFTSFDGSASATRYARGRLTISMPAPVGVSIKASYRLEYGRLSLTPLTPD